MDATLDPEQSHLYETARRVADDLAISGVAGLASEDVRWDLIVELGWDQIRVRDADGEPQATGVEVALIAEALGGRLCRLPFGGSAILPVELAALSGASEALRDRTGVVALKGDFSGLAERGSDAVAWDTGSADAFLALGEVEGGEVEVLVGDLVGERLELADLTRAAVGLRPSALDQMTAVGRLGREASQRWMALSLLTVAADQLGVMERAKSIAVEYAKEREQFGRPIGSFQAVSHACANMHVRCEASRSAVYYAAWGVDALESAEGALGAARIAKAYCSKIGPWVVEAAIQVLGGIGVTWENEAHLLLRRMRVDRHLLGNEHVQHAELRAVLTEA